MLSIIALVYPALLEEPELDLHEIVFLTFGVFLWPRDLVVSVLFPPQPLEPEILKPTDTESTPTQQPPEAENKESWQINKEKD